MVSGLIRCLNGEESICDASCSFNGSINGSFAERLLNTPDGTELCRVLQQIKDEVTRLFAMSHRPDPLVAKLQDEIKSLQQQVGNQHHLVLLILKYFKVVASDKQVRSTRGFLEEQAAEREMERDDACKRIEELTDLLRGKDRQLGAKELLEQDVSLIVYLLII